MIRAPSLAFLPWASSWAFCELVHEWFRLGLSKPGAFSQIFGGADMKATRPRRPALRIGFLLARGLPAAVALVWCRRLWTSPEWPSSTPAWQVHSSTVMAASPRWQSSGVSRLLDTYHCLTWKFAPDGLLIPRACFQHGWF